MLKKETETQHSYNLTMMWLLPLNMNLVHRRTILCSSMLWHQTYKYCLTVPQGRLPLVDRERLTCLGLASRPREVAIILLTSCHGNKDKLSWMNLLASVQTWTLYSGARSARSEAPYLFKKHLTERICTYLSSNINKFRTTQLCHFTTCT